MKNIIESVLVKHLGKYIDGLKNSLDIGLLDGEVTIENVSLKPSFINELNMPFTLRFSHIQKILIEIPWTSLKDKSTIVTIRGIYALFSINYTEGDEEVNPQQVLKGMLERIRLQMKKKWSQSAKDETFAEKNLIRIVDNAILNINNIHIRFQSYKRNWDYSMGVIMDNISSHTVDENHQRSFYRRSFSKKETNPPFHKLLNIDTCQLYFNDNEKLFIINEPKNRSLLLKMMAYPFAYKDKDKPLQNQNRKKPNDKSTEQLKLQQTYELKNIAVIALSALGTQKFAEDMRYNVQLDVNISKIEISLSDRQLSQLVFMVQHFYDFALNLDKNGRKTFLFDEDTRKLYRSLITKIARDQKITKQESSQMEAIIQAVPTSILEEINDEVINDVRIEKEVKKINKVSNAEKSKQMMEDLLVKKERLTSMEGVELFKQVAVRVKLERMVTSLYISQGKGVEKFAELGLYCIVLDCVMDLSWLIKVSCSFSKQLFKYRGQEITSDWYDLSLPWLHLYAEIQKDQLKKLEIQLQKKEYHFDQDMLNQLIGWISLIRIRPSLLNYIQEQLKYSIDITRVMMQFMFHKGRQLKMSFSMPILNIKLDLASSLKIDFGHFFGQNSERNDQYQMLYNQPLQIHSNQQLIFEMGAGTLITLQDKIEGQNNYEQVIFNIPKIQLTNFQEIIRLIYAFRTSGALSIIHKYQELNLLDLGLEEELEGEFYLNKLKHRLNMKLSRTDLVFSPVDHIEHFPEQRISLVRTRIYKLVSDKRYFIVFKEEVDRLVNIVEASSEKTMGTIFCKLKDYIYQISTSFQWHKYYIKPYQENILTLQHIQDTALSNNILMLLTVNAENLAVQFSQDCHLKINKAAAKIIYNEFNTEASVQLLKVDLIVQSEKVIYDASFRGRYEYLQSMVVELQVLRLGYEVKLHRTVTNIIKVASQYELLIFDLRSKRKKPVFVIEEDESRLSQIKSQSSRTDNLFKFLLERRFTIQTTNIHGNILGYSNKLTYIKLEIEKYRNEEEPRLQASMKGIVLLSMIELPLITLKHTATELEIQLDSINAEVDLTVLIYELIKGEGSLILKQFVKAYRDKQIAKHSQQEAFKDSESLDSKHRQVQRDNQSENQKDKQSEKQRGDNRMKQYLSKRAFVLSVEYIKVQVSITGQLCLGFLCKNVQVQMGRLSWDGLIFMLNKECISINENNAILKWSDNTLDLVMTNVKLKLNSKEVIFLSNQLYKIHSFLKRSNFDLLQLIKQEYAHPDDQGRVLQHQQITLNLRIEEFQLIYECADRNPLLSIRMKPIFLTSQGHINTINLSMWHLNRTLKLYEPVLEPFELKIVEKPQSHQLDLLFQNIYVVVSEQLAVDVLEELKLLKVIKKELEKDESNQLEQMNEDEVRLIKRTLFSEHYEEYTRPIFQKTVEYSFTLKIKSYLNCECLAEVTCGRSQKQLLHFQHFKDADIKMGSLQSISIAQKTSYSSSYELIERYQKINIKICLLNHFYATSPVNVSFLLYDKDNHYITAATVLDQNGREIHSHLLVHVQYTEGVYQVDIKSMYTIQNQTNLPLFFRYSDSFSINKFALHYGESIPLPLWLVQSINFGIEEGDYCHLLRLRAQESIEQPGYYELIIAKDANSNVSLIIHKEKITHEKRATPKLNYLNAKKQQNQASQEHAGQKKEDHKEEVIKQEKKLEGCCFMYRIIPGVLIRNHLLFPVKVNETFYEQDTIQELSHLYEDKQKKKEYVKLGLGDGSIHEVFLPAVDEEVSVNLKLLEDNFVVVYLQVRRNRLSQRVLHIYAEVELIMNVHNMFVPVLKTNIYNHYFIMKKEVKNNYSDKLHPSPVLKDKFVFNTYHYLLSLEEKYISAKLHDCTSNEIILYHSDYDVDLRFKSAESEDDEFVFAVSYQTKIIELQSPQQGRKPDILECNYTYIMPKYYLINRSEESFVVEGHTIIRSGEKVPLDRINQIELNVRDQVEFRYMSQQLEDSTYILFIRGKEEPKQQIQQQVQSKARGEVAYNFAAKHSHKSSGLDGISELSEQDGSRNTQQIEFIEVHHYQRQDSLQVASRHSRTEPDLTQAHSNEQQIGKVIDLLEKQDEFLSKQAEVSSENDSVRDFRRLAHRVKMEDIIIFALSKRVCDYNTISYEIHEWHEWLTVRNDLGCTIILRVQLNQQALGEEVIGSGQTGKVISGLSDKLEISLVLNGEEVILDRYTLSERLNHNIFLQGCEFREVVLKENKVKLGRYMVIASPEEKKDRNIYKAVNSINLLICKISVSLVLREHKNRTELIRFNIQHPKFMLLHYKNGLYMVHLKFDQIVGICHRMPFLVLKDFEGYVEGFKGEFVERVAVQIKETLEVSLTDELIAILIQQLQILQKYLPRQKLLEGDEQILQEQQTYHINSIGIKPIEIKLCLRKVPEGISDYQAKLLSKISLSMIEIEDATINLSPVEINVPIKQKHINGITKMYTMEAFVGVASGLNILGNPSQFVSQFQAGRNRGGVIPLVGSMVAGISNSISKIIGTIGSGFSELTFDREFIRNRIKDKNTRAESFGMGLKIGMKEFVLSIKDGIVGLIYQPIQGHQEEGGLGVLKGTVFGITGLVTKPVSGIFLAISKTIEGINSTITNLDYDRLIGKELIMRPLYHKFQMVRPYRSEDQLAYNILLNWYDYKDVQLVGSYLLQSEEGDSVSDLLIITCSELLLIDLNEKELVMQLRMEELLATGKFQEGVVLYFEVSNAEDSQEELVFRLSRDNAARENLYWTLKSFINLYSQC